MDPELSPLSGSVTVTERHTARGRTSMTAEPGEQVFAGHYPAFAILPGLCVVEFIRRSALATAPEAEHGWRMTDIISARFREPVLPGDTLTADVQWTRDDGNSWQVTATVMTGRGPAARVRLRFRAEDPC